jgi:hypothetical protein
MKDDQDIDLAIIDEMVKSQGEDSCENCEECPYSSDCRGF